MKLSAIIFDLNGTVLSDEDEYGAAFAKVLRRLGVKVTSSYPHVAGIGVEENWAIFIKKYKIATEKTTSELAAETQEEYYRLIPSVTLKKGFEDFVAVQRKAGVKTALATSNSWSVVEEIFERFDIEKYFVCVTSKEEVVKNKPDPQIFVTTLEKLGAEPFESLVVEDSAAGVRAAGAAGIKAVGMYRNAQHRKRLKEAVLTVKDFGQLTKKRIEEL